MFVLIRGHIRTYIVSTLYIHTCYRCISCIVSGHHLWSSCKWWCISFIKGCTQQVSNHLQKRNSLTLLE